MAKNKQHSPEFRVQVVERMLAGENVMALSKQYGLARSMMYRWRDAYRNTGPAGLARRAGRGKPQPAETPAGAIPTSDNEQKLRQRIAELERVIGQQAVDLDFFKGVFKRLKESPKAPRRGDEASTRRSGE
jgi:transposase-like protein